MEGLGLLAGLLGGYQQGRQLKQNRALKQAQLTRETARDAATLAHQKKMEEYAGRRLTIAENPQAKTDTGPSLIFDRQLDPVREYWKTWNNNINKETTMAGRKRVIDEGLGKLPYHRQLVKSALGTYGPQLGYTDDTDPDLFLGGMHGMSGVTFDPKTGAYGAPKDVYSKYAPAVSTADKAALRQQIEAISNSPNMPIAQQRAAMQALRDRFADLYGEDNAKAEIPYLPGDDVTTGYKTLDVEGKPEALGNRPEPVFNDATNPFLGTNIEGGVARRTVPQQNLLGMFGTDAPGMFAPQEQKDAYQSARYNAPKTLGTYRPGNFNPTQGQFNMAPTFQPSPIDSNPADFADPDKEFRRGFAMRVMSGSPQNEEEKGLQQFIESQRQYNPNFDPFRNQEDLRFTLQMAGPNIAPTLHRSAAKMATGAGSSLEFVPTTQKTVPVTGKYTIAPKASAISALASADYTNEQIQTAILMRQPNYRLALARENEIQERISNDKWRQRFDAAKFNDESDRGWKTLGISRDRLNFDIDKDKFDRFIKGKKLVQDDITFVQSLTKHQDLNVKTIDTELKSVTAEIGRAQASQWLNHTSLGSVDDSILAKVQGGQELSLDEFNSLTAEQKMAVNEQINMGRLARRAATLRAQLATENGKLDTAREWEAATRKEFSGQAAREKELVTAWKKHNPRMTAQEIQEALDAGLAPPKPTKKGNTAGPGTVDPFAGRK
jgi:hypothetical protein